MYRPFAHFVAGLITLNMYMVQSLDDHGHSCLVLDRWGNQVDEQLSCCNMQLGHVDPALNPNGVKKNRRKENLWLDGLYPNDLSSRISAI